MRSSGFALDMGTDRLSLFVDPTMFGGSLDHLVVSGAPGSLGGHAGQRRDDVDPDQHIVVVDESHALDSWPHRRKRTAKEHLEFAEVLGLEERKPVLGGIFDDHSAASRWVASSSVSSLALPALPNDVQPPS